MYKMPRLSLLMFIQYFLQGTWSMTIGAVLAENNMDQYIGTTYVLLGLATMLSPIFIGMLADRIFPAQNVMGILHLLNSVALYSLPFTIFSQNQIAYFSLIFIIGLLYYPTAVLANSITFRHLNDSKVFPLIRVTGNIGFIISGLTMGYFTIFADVIIFKLAAIVSVCCAIYCFTLPHTPPLLSHSRLDWRALLCLDALVLFKNRYFSLFMLITLFVMIAKTAYSAYIPVYLKDLQMNAATMIQIGVISEVFLMLLLGQIIKKWGIKWVLAIGIIAWAVRSYLLSVATTAAEPSNYILLGLILQGICWTFFFVAGDIYVNDQATAQIKAQAQSLRFIFSNGIGVVFSSYLIGILYNSTVTDHKLPNMANQWAEFWLCPSVVAMVSAVVFIVGFRKV